MKKIKNFIASKYSTFMVQVTAFILTFTSNVYAAGALESAKGLLSKGAIAGGGLWAVWGLVQLGMAVKDHNGPGISGAIWQVIGGGIIIAAGGLITAIDLTMA